MTLEEAIEHLEKTLSDSQHDWGCESCKEEHEQLLSWLEELQKTRLKEVPHEPFRNS